MIPKYVLPTESQWASLSERELQVLRYLALGWSNKHIADWLRVSGSTVNFHVANVLQKLAAANRAHAVSLAMHGGMIRLRNVVIENGITNGAANPKKTIYTEATCRRSCFEKTLSHT